VSAPIERAFATISDIRTYADWGARTYLSCQSDGPPIVGRVVRVCVKGPLPFKIRFDLTVLRMKTPFEIQMAATGDIDGVWLLALKPESGRITIHSDWCFSPRRSPPRLLRPLLRPLFRWNHTASVARAYQGLQRYLDRQEGPATQSFRS
jgi:hypothetical protein